VITTDGRQSTGFRDREKQELVHDAKYYLRPRRYPEFFEHAIEVGMHRVHGNVKSRRDGGFLLIIKNAPNDFQLAARQRQRPG